MQDLRGRVAVVTGAASGLGFAMARRFSREGMHVVMADVEDEPLQRSAEVLRSHGGEVTPVRTDVSVVEDVERLADRAFAVAGAVHVLCNNAGVVKSGRAWALTLDDWNWVFDVDLWGVVHGIRAFVPRMLTQGAPGHIVNTASVAGLLPMPNLAAYAAAKSGVVAVSEVLRLDLAAEGAAIGVSVLCPGWVPTRILDSERNRPPTRAMTGPDPSTPRTTTGVQPTMDADDVAELVLQAVVDGRFWILTHDQYREVIRERAAGIGGDGSPAAAPVW